MSHGDQSPPAGQEGTPVGRRVVLGMLGLAGVGVVLGSRLSSVISTIAEADPTGLTGLHTGFGETVFFPAQLRHLLAAKRSAEVAQENQHKLPLLPELAEAFGRIVRQGHRQIGRFRVILFHLFFSQTDDTVPLLARWSSMSFDRTRLS